MLTPAVIVAARQTGKLTPKSAMYILGVSFSILCQAACMAGVKRYIYEF